MKVFFNRSRFSRDLKRLVKENAAQGKPLTLMDDLVFKAMLSSDTEDSKEALRSLLSACIRRKVLQVQVTANDLVPSHLEAKAARLDVHVIFNDGEVADLEMQVDKTGDDLALRAALYAAMLQSAQSRKGRSYGEIKRVYQIFFLNCILYPQSSKLPRRYGYREETEHDLLTEATEIIFYEMPKLDKQVWDYLNGKASSETLREDEKWCIYMKYRHERQVLPLIEELCRKEEGIMRAEKAVARIDRDYLKYAREMAIEKNRLDRGQEQYNARKEGLAEGRAKGLAEGLAEGKTEGHMEEKLEIARKLKKMGLSTIQIVEGTGLSPNTIEKI